MSQDLEKLQAVNGSEYSLVASLDSAETIVDEAMAYSDINPDTAPVRYEAAQKAARYATYVALGLVDSADLVRPAFAQSQDKQTQSKLSALKSIAYVRNRMLVRHGDPMEATK